jgi:D-threo-aldose 1-dehydrogenase
MTIRDKLISGPLSFGAAPLGKLFRDIPEEEAASTVEAAWQQAIRYFDTAPFYGAGLSEIRLGKALAKHKRSEYVLSSKVGRLIVDRATVLARSPCLGRRHPARQPSRTACRRPCFIHGGHPG